MSERIYIAIPVRGRKQLAHECIKTIDDARHNTEGERLNDDILALYEDGYDQLGEAECCADEVHRSADPIGIDKQRARHFIDFWHCYRRKGLTHLYLTDADAPHDVLWRENLLRLQNLFGGQPICGYRTETHARYLNNIYHDNPNEDVLFQRFAPGVSYLLTVEHVMRVMDHIQNLRDWDWMVPALLGHKMAVSRVSYVDHIGMGGAHDPADGSIGPERATNPTEYLVQKRKEIIECLTIS